MKNKGKILIVDDNEEILFSLEIFLEKHFEKVKTLKRPDLINTEIGQDDYDVVILDMNFTVSDKSGNEGLFWMHEILRRNSCTSVIFITAFPGIELAVKAIKNGAFDFIEKPWGNEKLLATVNNAVKMHRSKQEIAILKEKQDILVNAGAYQFVRGTSPVMQRIYDTIGKVAITDASVLILGENGTGKELIAREIHSLSDRNRGPFIKVDVGVLPDTLFESEIFGHEKGAFTDAKIAKPGKIEVASGGTLFLDEIGNLNPGLQSKLLGVIQERSLTRIGSNKSRFVDFRLICATNRPLYEMVDHQQFREDLLYRINTVQIDLPPLRQRIKDIPEFIGFFLEKHKTKYKRQDIIIDESGLNRLTNYDWPGNIRQLDHMIENLVIMTEGEIISESHISLNDQGKKLADKNTTLNYYQNERSLVESVLNECNGNLSKAADVLGVARSTLYRKIKKYDL